MRRWKKILSASLVAVMVGSLGMTAFAEDTSANEPIDTTVSNYNLTEEETSGKNQEEIKALQQQKIDEVTQQAYDMKIASNELENWPEGRLLTERLELSWRQKAVRSFMRKTLTERLILPVLQRF